jgi:CBS-domain-containing membrane protein
VPVVDDQGQLVGIVSHTDILQMIEKAEAPAGSTET